MVSAEVIHFLAGGVGGTVAALITCPLEVVKVRLQATKRMVANIENQAEYINSRTGHPNILSYIKMIIKSEGRAGLFKGVGPTLLGVIPSRGVYFSSYSYTQTIFNQILPPDSMGVYFFSAALSSAISSTVTNPIWYVKTRLQLDLGAGNNKITVWKIIRHTYNEKGVFGFYRGVTASYAGITESGLNFMLYEKLKVTFLTKFHEWRNIPKEENSQQGTMTINSISETFLCMAASTISKFVATTAAYPHEVARTRLREEGTKYRGFFQTINLVYHEESYPGLYRGLTAHYLRQIPNTCIMMGVYELVKYIMKKYCNDNKENN